MSQDAAQDRPEIVAVDDTPQNLQVLHQILSVEGYKVRPVTDPRAAIPTALVSPPDLFLLDVNMPGMNGYELCREIKKRPEEGFVLLGKMSHIRPASAYMVREHHLRYDRKGYPELGPDYPVNPQSQIIAVSDCYDAITTMRAYQKAKQPLEALEIMGKLSGKSLDANILAVLKSVMGSYPIGTMVRLNSMEVGVITGVGPAGLGPIKIQVLVDRQGNPLPRPEEVELVEIAARTPHPRQSILGTVNPLLYPDAQKGALQSAPPS